MIRSLFIKTIGKFIKNLPIVMLVSVSSLDFVERNVRMAIACILVPFSFKAQCVLRTVVDAGKAELASAIEDQTV